MIEPELSFCFPGQEKIYSRLPVSQSFMHSFQGQRPDSVIQDLCPDQKVIICSLSKLKKLTKEIMVRSLARVNVGQPKPACAFQDKRRRSLARIADKERLSLEE